MNFTDWSSSDDGKYPQVTRDGKYLSSLISIDFIFISLLCHHWIKGKIRSKERNLLVSSFSQARKILRISWFYFTIQWSINCNPEDWKFSWDFTNGFHFSLATCKSFSLHSPHFPGSDRGPERPAVSCPNYQQYIDRLESSVHLFNSPLLFINFKVQGKNW